MPRGPVVRVQRGEANELKNTGTSPGLLWSNIFNLASFCMSVNQRALSVLDADDIDLGVNERGALVLASAVLELVLTASF